MIYSFVLHTGMRKSSLLTTREQCQLLLLLLEEKSTCYSYNSHFTKCFATIAFCFYKLDQPQVPALCPRCAHTPPLFLPLGPYGPCAWILLLNFFRQQSLRSPNNRPTTNNSAAIAGDRKFSPQFLSGGGLCRFADSLILCGLVCMCRPSNVMQHTGA